MKVSILILFVISNRALSAPIEVKSNQLANRSIKSSQEFNSPKTQHTRRIKNETYNNSPELEEVRKIDLSSNLEVKKYLSKNAIAAWDFTNRFDVKTGSAIKGILLNSVVSSNLESPILVEIVESFAGIPEGSKFSCSGITKNKRVLAVCNKLITGSDEYEVDTILLNNDGTAGLLGRAYSGKEQYAVGAITAAALKGALDVSLDRVNTSFGTEQITTNGRNKIKSGGIGALDEIVQMSTDEFKTQEPKISIDAGKEILVYFNRRFKL